MNDLAAELWSTLPTELVERMLSFLSVPELCRFRTVCKSWNSLICTAEFGAQCNQHARQDAGFIVLREERGWSLLDMSARRWYDIHHDDQEVSGFAFMGSLAMDGGLVCQHLYEERSQENTIFVSNHVAKTWRRLPSCTAIAGRGMTVQNMIVDNVAQNYKIFLMPDVSYGESISANEPFLVVYESTTNQWRNSAILNTPLHGFPFHRLCSAFLNGLLYILVSPYPGTPIVQDNFWSYNDVEDVWESTCVNILTQLYHYPQLIVSDNRLFLAYWLRECLPDAHNQSDGWSFEISEVHLGDRTTSRVFEMTEDVMRQNFGVAESVTQMLSPVAWTIYLRAFGLCKSIVLICKPSRISVVYDLSTSLWELLPRKPLREDDACWLHGNPMNLILPVNTLLGAP